MIQNIPYSTVTNITIDLNYSTKAQKKTLVPNSCTFRGDASSIFLAKLHKTIGLNRGFVGVNTGPFCFAITMYGFTTT